MFFFTFLLFFLLWEILCGFRFTGQDDILITDFLNQFKSREENVSREFSDGDKEKPPAQVFSALDDKLRDSLDRLKSMRSDYFFHSLIIIILSIVFGWLSGWEWGSKGTIIEFILCYCLLFLLGFTVLSEGKSIISYSNYLQVLQNVSCSLWCMTYRMRRIRNNWKRT